MASIPASIVKYILLGKSRPDEIERYTQDAGISTDIWLAFADNMDATLRVLVSPVQGVSGVKLASALHRGIHALRLREAGPNRKPAPPGVSPLDSYVAASIGLDELLQVLMPMTAWWSRVQLSSLQQAGSAMERHLKSAIETRFAKSGSDNAAMRKAMADDSASIQRLAIEAAPIAALIGVFEGVKRGKLPSVPNRADRMSGWLTKNAHIIASAAHGALSRQFGDALKEARTKAGSPLRFGQYLQVGQEPPLIQRVFLDRKVNVADINALGTIKADAAARVFDVSCSAVTWAVIDSGIAGKHPAFLDHGAKDAAGAPIVPPPSRVRATYDFTRLEVIRSYDLTLSPAGTKGREADIASAIDQLLQTPGRRDTPEFRDLAGKNLALIAMQLDSELTPDWSLIEPLIRLEITDGSELVSDHGTHVAGVLGADWRDPARPSERMLQGVCPDINLFDLRVIHESSQEGAESAVISALEFVRFLNQKAASEELVISGVNISMSIPYDPKKYGCGVTPVCTACDRLSDSGVVVVVAAGNKGWNTQQFGFSTFSFCSITDPGNAHQVITVGSTHGLKPHLYGVSYFSSRGPTGDGRIKPDLVAPGEKIRGPVRGNAEEVRDGTSFAAPFVSGAAAMLIARHKELMGDPQRVKQILCSTATDLGREKYFQGHGLVDVLRALQSV